MKGGVMWADMGVVSVVSGASVTSVSGTGVGAFSGPVGFERLVLSISLEHNFSHINNGIFVEVHIMFDYHGPSFGEIYPIPL